MRRLIWILPLGCLVLLAIWYTVTASSSPNGTYRTVAATRGSVVRHATAVGRIEVEHEVPIKSLNGGILTTLYVKLGQRVERGDPLAEVRPLPTTLNVLQAERALDLAREGEERAREFVRGEHLAGWMTRWIMGSKNLARMQKEASLTRKQAEEQLELLKEGQATVDERTVDYVVRAPVTGHVLDIRQREGAPVVPASSYGSGTVFMTLADMSRLIFRGTVDEIDVGRLTEGTKADITVGALPELAITGTLSEIALQGHTVNNAVNFAVRITVDVPEGTVLRSGYSAVARIEVDRRDGVLTVPERVVRFRDGKAFCRIRDPRGEVRDVEVRTGLSDGLTVEILGGLAEGQTVLERVYD